MTLPVLAVALLYGALELAALLLFLRPYAHQGLARRCDTPSRRALRLLFCVAMAFAFAALRVGQSLPGMVLNILLHFAAVALTGFTLYDLPLTQMLNSSLVFHLSLDMCKSLLWDMLPFLKSFRMESSALDQLMLTLPLMALQALCCLALRQTACAPHDRRMNRTMAALIFLPAVPYLYVKSLQYRSFMIGDVSYSGAMSALCFLVCLLAVAVSLLSNRLVAGIDRERRAEHEHMTLERLEAQMAQHQQQIDNINKLSHDMRNHLATLAAMGGSKEAADYIAALTHRFAPVTVRKISGCPVLDVLLAQKMDECSRVGASLIPCISQEAIGALCALSGPDLSTASTATCSTTPSKPCPPCRTERIKPSPCAPICAAVCSSSARKIAIRANAATRAAAFPPPKRMPTRTVTVCAACATASTIWAAK